MVELDHFTSFDGLIVFVVVLQSCSCGGRRKPYLLERGHGDRPQAQDLDLDNGGMVGVMEWSLLCPGAMDSFSREALSSSSTRMYKQHPRTDPAENPWCHLRANLSSFPFDFTLPYM
ncbi:uncharacterized protein [Triticum aestivum]|uniref:uncharacterized protein isoform X3 n=1 Tax=Triticum aestivum TaxID=4565 RepID=UPI001D0034C1|nr:uncharacterized protein LOC123093505 isoform X3 [Triticum aestivum]